MSATAAHMMLRVHDEATSVAFYRAAFGLEIAERADFETFTLIYMRNANSPFEVELTVNKDRSAPYDLGDGYGHIAFVVDDLEAEHARISAAGLAPRDIKSMALGSKPFARFFFIDDPDGYKIEVIERGGRFA
jgi:lactoylglutathione lyase